MMMDSSLDPPSSPHITHQDDNYDDGNEKKEVKQQQAESFFLSSSSFSRVERRRRERETGSLVDEERGGAAAGDGGRESERTSEKLSERERDCICSLFKPETRTREKEGRERETAALAHLSPLRRLVSHNH